MCGSDCVHSKWLISIQKMPVLPFCLSCHFSENVMIMTRTPNPKCQYLSGPCDAGQDRLGTKGRLSDPLPGSRNLCPQLPQFPT